MTRLLLVDDDRELCEMLQEYLAGELPEESPIYNELHALLVNVGHHHCRKTPRCEECPLREMLPEGGIVASSD